MDIMGFLRARAGDFRCPVCRRSLADCQLRQVAHEGSQYTVQVTCNHCAMAFLVALEVQGAAEEEEQVEQAEELPEITADEILDVHRALSRLSGSLTALLEAPPGTDPD